MSADTPGAAPGVRVGRSHPLGAAVERGGVNFSVYSRSATRLELLFFDAVDADMPSRVLDLDGSIHRAYHYWHVFVPGVKAGQLYGYRVHGPKDPAKGLRFDGDKLLLDPYGRGVAVPPKYSRRAACGEGVNIATAMKSVVVNSKAYDWEGDEPLRRPASRTIVYEMHVKGFTRHPSSGVSERKRGTYAGVIEKIPYLTSLGITAVELLPVFQFDPQDAPAGKANYWGYSPLAFFAPHQAYSSRSDPLGAVDEFRDMVKALHRAGIEVILDVVYNHTAEGNENGPTLCHRGFENAAYYMLDADSASYANYTGTGNTLNANHPVVRRMIIDSLRYWVRDMHVDGFRFDLASILARDVNGNVLPNPPILLDIESDPLLAGTKIIAEAWDAAGLYQVGSFVGDSWREWNGKFRDDVRDFLRGEPGMISRVANRMLGSPDIYGHEEREAEQSVNFVTCHDGFTLNDLVSYNEKHNLDNGEENRDGANDNRSWNCGVEGPTDDPAVEALRNRQVKNFLTLTLLSYGMPMVTMGDEMRRTQRGNNNAYCQDNEISWLDWTLLEKHGDVKRFFELLAERRLLRDAEPELRRTSLNQLLHGASIVWHGVKCKEPDWSGQSRAIAHEATLAKERLQFYFAVNAYWEPLDFELPACAATGRMWRRWIDTGLPSPDDIVSWNHSKDLTVCSYRLQPRSIVALFTHS